MDPVEKLELDLSAISDAYTFVSVSREFRNWSGDLLSTGGLNSSQRDLLIKLRKDADQDTPVIENALMVSAWGSFEDFIRGLLPFVAKKLNDCALPTKSAIGKLVNQNTLLTADALAVTVGGSKLHTFSVLSLAKNLSQSHEKDGVLILNEDAFGRISGKFSVEDLILYIGRLGYDLKWSEVGTSKGIQKFFNCDNKTSAGNLAEKFLSKLIDDRNKIAHQGGSSLSPQYTIKEVVDFLMLFAAQLNGLLVSHVKVCKDL